MAIGSSDLFKNSIDLGVGQQLQHARTESFAQEKTRETKTVTPLNESQNVQADARNKQREVRDKREKVDFQQLMDSTKSMAQLNIKLSFDVSGASKDNVVKVLDQETGELVRQIPTEEFVEMSERIQALLSELGDIKGALVNREV
ncbi:Flagellar protein FlaG protein [Marinomonas sp. MED121]|jgi:flagellar protein FlaG|uniref:flagellar protein FlaG n=1 Tax=Marinomonas sp. MED121 TaxID=314277 RepID=UPI00006902E5|nr:flagellar protein FlaG [Marinomonas sp. MED121]EAQ66408.1 Flagellar protein FlaG protein [Marinomonas sp. MED121]